MGLLQGPRPMAWTTKSQIQGNQWVPLGCRALLGSVTIFADFEGKKMPHNFWTEIGNSGHSVYAINRVS